MAPPKLSFSGNFITQTLFGLFLTLVFLMTGYPSSLSIFLGVLGGIAIGWLTSAQKTGPKQPDIGVSEGIDVGLKYWLFFLLGFVFAGYNPPMGILLGAIAGIGGGWIIAWWETKEDSRTQLPTDDTEDAESALPDDKPDRRRVRKISRKFRRRTSGGINLRFWER
ncbi:hypothetical protein WA1_44005 [Scytonema hofmannii PCC 7110]|uniref:Uncharacterized protein n=1 Tax=Scytonema hofmannii PCC 7110 TaxID=128403 RepID=A0A139WW68_9CYAN|nr:hypothetical protein [Scytonema hofmannii]KYC36653.1 hypothetical protein WA1_44005 [Scytonema hofmannii PCC 7110]